MQGKLVRLRGYEKSDAEALVRWFSDEEVTDFLGPMEFPVTRAKQEAFVDSAATGADPRAKSFAIETLDGVLIGDCGLRMINWINRSAELVIMIGEKSYWGNGYGSDAVRLLLRLGFDKMNLHRVYLSTLATNARAHRCYEKCGFKRQGLWRESSFVAGRYVDVITMGVLKSEYQALAHN
jgi:RimJ/RimL family protein N-acetyltransferase